jgi:hypothetical protein
LPGPRLSCALLRQTMPTLSLRSCETAAPQTSFSEACRPSAGPCPAINAVGLPPFPVRKSFWGARTRGYGRKRCTTETTVPNGRTSTGELGFSAGCKRSACDGAGVGETSVSG